MNAEQVKEKLNAVYSSEHDYAVVFSGKCSKLINGLYKPAAKEIIIHNKNFTDDNLLMYTAIHELAHHVCMAEKGARGTRAHTQLFWSVFHDLLDSAVSKKIYIRKQNDALDKLVERAKEIDRQIAKLQRELGEVLIEINRISAEANVRFEDVVDSGINLSRKTKNAAIKAAQQNVPEQYGQDIQNLLIGTKDDKSRNDIAAGAESGKSIDQIKQRVSKQNSISTIERLEKEKNMLEKTIETLGIRLRQIINEIQQYNGWPQMENAADSAVNNKLFKPKGEKRNGKD